MQIKVLGTAGLESTRLADLVKTVIASAGVDAALEKVEEYREIVRHGVMSMPALIIDGKVLCRGRVPSLEEICLMLNVPLPRKLREEQPKVEEIQEEIFSERPRIFMREIRK